MYIFDLAKAFDTVQHKRLVKKIKVHGIDGNILQWIKAWLNCRKQKAVIPREPNIA